MLWQFLQLMFILWLGATVVGLLIHVIVTVVGIVAALKSGDTSNRHYDYNGDQI